METNKKNEIAYNSPEARLWMDKIRFFFFSPLLFVWLIRCCMGLTRSGVHQRNKKGKKGKELIRGEEKRKGKVVDRHVEVFIWCKLNFGLLCIKCLMHDAWVLVKLSPNNESLEASMEIYIAGAFHLELNPWIGHTILDQYQTNTQYMWWTKYWYAELISTPSITDTILTLYSIRDRDCKPWIL